MRKILKIDALLKFSKTITLVSLGISLLSVFASLSYVFYFNKKLIKEKIYMLDRNGDAFTAKIIKDELMYREPEINSHLKKFHEYFFNLDQYNYVKNIEKSLELIDESGKDYYLTLLNQGWYNSLKMNNLKQKIEIDSILVNVNKYPYSASLFGKTTVFGEGREREEKIIKIHCILYDVARTRNNPHGLLISDYEILYHGEK